MSEARKIAAILVADVVGYSRLAEADEVRTLSRLRGLRSDLFDPAIAAHRGRVVKRTGDGAVVEFRSVVDAVDCAVEIQRGMIERNIGLPNNRRIEFRIGIHLGDVFEESDGDLMGDGVNIAARLEGVAEAGGICLSGAAHEQVRDKFNYGFFDAGETALKNIARRVRVFKLIMEKDAVGSQVPAQQTTKPRHPLPKKPSIAVLPFANMSTNPEQEFFADGLTEDLITELSRGSDLFVIARHSSFAFKGKSFDIRRIAEELGVRYILEGSARRSTDRIRINAQLIDAQDGGHLWAERYDRQLADVFAIQDEVVGHIVKALVGKLAAASLPERAVPKNIEAYDFLVRGRFLYRNMSAPEGIEARDLFTRAVALDPDYAEAHAYLGLSHWLGWTNWFEPVDPHRRLAVAHAKRAVALDPNDPWAHTVLSHILNYEHDYDEAAAQSETALRLDPNHADTLAFRADLLVMHGRPLEALTCAAQAMRLNPRAPALYYWMKGEAEYAARHYEDAIETLRHEATYTSASRSILAAALAQLGRLDEAKVEGRLFMADYPDFRIKEFLSTQAFRDESDREHFADGYRKAALPEH